MLNKIKILSLSVCAAFVLQACHSDDDALFDIPADEAPDLVNDIQANGYAALRGNADVDGLFLLAQAVSGTADADLCDVKTHRMVFDTSDGSGGTTKSSGVVMVPYGESEACSGPRPVVLYAHGTSADKNYDISQLAASPANPAASEAAVLLAFYASKGYTVIAPNYVGYSQEGIDADNYHPYVNEAQQSGEMIDALNHVKTYAGDIGAELSPKLFISGVSQGGYVAMATHKALQAAGETVTASVPISGPYALRDFLDSITAGRINGGATTFAPMYLTALEEGFDIYDDPSEVYAADYLDSNNILPAPGAAGAASVGLPADADFFDFISTGFSANYVNDVNGVTTTPNAASKVRALAQEADLRDWAPSPAAGAPVVMCGAGDDPVVFHDINSDAMATAWAPLVQGGLVTNLDLTDTPSGNFATIQGAWQQAAIPTAAIHGTTGVYCAAAALATFNTL